MKRMNSLESFIVTVGKVIPCFHGNETFGIYKSQPLYPISRNIPHIRILFILDQFQYQPRIYAQIF